MPGRVINHVFSLENPGTSTTRPLIFSKKLHQQQSICDAKHSFY